jgi:ubiquinone/menaquinone biosynthesis C-methylase UbiE
VSRAYDQLANAYDFAYNTPWFRSEDSNVAQHLKAVIRTGDSVLDVGCGTGKAIELIHLARLEGFTYTGLDISAEMVRLAQEKFPDHHFNIANIAALPHADHTFDVVISTYGALSHVPDIESALAEIERVVKPGGRVFLMVYGSRKSHGRGRARVYTP